eukprot:13832668-Alexandrium_andersonii.AAC.1
MNARWPSSAFALLPPGADLASSARTLNARVAQGISQHVPRNPGDRCHWNFRPACSIADWLQWWGR